MQLNTGHQLVAPTQQQHVLRFPNWQSCCGAAHLPIHHPKTDTHIGVQDSQNTALSTVFLGELLLLSIPEMTGEKKEGGKRLDLKKEDGVENAKQKARRSMGESVIKGLRCVLNDALIP